MKTRVVQLGAAIAVVVILGITAPSAARAVNVELVRLANTLANPVITQPVNAAASQMVLLHMPRPIADGAPVPMIQFQLATGDVPGPYEVPEGQKLVITEIDITAHQTAGVKIVLLRTLAQGEPIETFYLPAAGSQQFRFTSGLVYPAGASVYAQNPTAAQADLTMHGYLTSN